MKGVGRSDGRTGKRMVVAAAMLLTCPTVRLSNQSPWRPDERAVITDFSFVTAVAASPSYVFGATPHGLIVYDRGAAAWLPPVTALDGYPAGVRVALADAVNDAVWLGTFEGWARYDVRQRLWERGAVPGGVRDLALDRRDVASGVFILGGMQGWGFLPRGALVPLSRPLPPAAQRIQPLTPEQAFARAPQAEAWRALLLTDPRLRSYQFTSAAHSEERSEIWFGTTGMGLIRVDGTTGQWDAVAFGLAGASATAVAAGAGGVWVAARGRVAERHGLGWVRDDLGLARGLEGAGTLGLPFTDGRRLLARGAALWVASERGVVRYDPNSQRARAVRSGNPGLPSDDVRALAPAPDGVWVGTSRGLALVSDEGDVTRFTALVDPVLSLVAVGETLWVGTSVGLGALTPGSAQVVAAGGTSALREPIVALARSGGSVVAATPDQLIWRDPATAEWAASRLTGDAGTITALAGDSGGVWVGGVAGLAFVAQAGGSARTLRVPFDLPAAVRDVVVDPPWLWVATDSGLVRFSRRAALGR